MKNSITLYLILMYTWLSMSGFSCYDCEKELNETSTFESSILPQQKIYSKLDTITLFASFDPMVLLNKSGGVYDLSNQNMRYDFHLFEVRPHNDTIVGGKEKFDISTKTGRFDDLLRPYDFTLWSQNSADSAGFEVKIVPLETGYFCIGLTRAHCFISECEQIGFFVEKFNKGNSNFRICDEMFTNMLTFKSFIPPGLTRPESERNYFFFKVI